MRRKRFWGITLALLLTATMILGQGTLSARDTEQELKTEGTEEQRLTEAASTEIKGKEKTPEIPKIGGGGQQNLMI